MLERYDDEHRTEDFFLGNPHVVGDVNEASRLDEPASPLLSPASSAER